MNLTQYYCYEDKCPGRTPEKPWPKSDMEFKRVEVTSRKGTKYKRKLWACKHCSEPMTPTWSVYDERYW